MTSDANAFHTEDYVYTPLIEQLQDESPAVREAACWALGELRYKAANRHLSKILGGDADEMVRLGAAMALGKIGGSYSTLALIRCLKDGSDLVRGFCVQTLGSLRDPQAVYPLEQMLRGESNETIKEHIHRALELLSGKRDGERGPSQRKIQKFMRQIEADPDNPIPYNNLAVTYFNQERYALAREFLEKAKERGANVRSLERRFAELPADKFTADPDHELPDDLSVAEPPSGGREAPREKRSEGTDSASGGDATARPVEEEASSQGPSDSSVKAPEAERSAAGDDGDGDKGRDRDRGRGRDRGRRRSRDRRRGGKGRRGSD